MERSVKKWCVDSGRVGKGTGREEGEGRDKWSTDPERNGWEE